MLWKFLGDKRVAFLIWQHGLPSVADPPTFKVLDMRMLQSGLDECLQWYVSLANDIVIHQSQEDFDVQLSASSLEEEERQRQQTRREALQKARNALWRGATLAKQMDDSKRSFYDMDADEQELLEDYHTGRAKKAKQDATTPRLKTFRCKLDSKRSYYDMDADDRDTSIPAGKRRRVTTTTWTTTEQSQDSDEESRAADASAAAEKKPRSVVTPASLQLLESGQVNAAEGYCLEAYMDAGMAWEQDASAARSSFEDAVAGTERHWRKPPRQHCLLQSSKTSRGRL